MNNLGRFFLSATLLLGTMIGAGIFGIPYVVAKSGVIPSFFYFLILGATSLLIHLFLGEVVLRTKEKHRLAGYAKKYLGGRGKSLIAFSIILGTILALVAYIILGGLFLKIFFSSYNFLTEISAFRLSLVFSILLSPFIFKGIKMVAQTELATNILFGLIILLIFFLNLPNVHLTNFQSIDFSNLFLPYGVILFALIGWSAVPEMTEILKSKQDKKMLKKAIIFPIFTAIILYLIFIFAVVGVSGLNASEETFSGLLPYLNEKVVAFGVLAGIITIADSFLILGLNLKNTLVYDYNIPSLLAFILAWGSPVLLFLLGLRHFIDVIGFAGTLIGAIEGIAIVCIFKKAKTMGNREPEYSLKVHPFVIFILVAIFILGALSLFF